MNVLREDCSSFDEFICTTEVKKPLPLSSKTPNRSNLPSPQSYPSCCSLKQCPAADCRIHLFLYPSHPICWCICLYHRQVFVFEQNRTIMIIALTADYSIKTPFVLALIMMATLPCCHHFLSTPPLLHSAVLLIPSLSTWSHLPLALQSHTLSSP